MWFQQISSSPSAHKAVRSGKAEGLVLCWSRLALGVVCVCVPECWCVPSDGVRMLLFCVDRKTPRPPCVGHGGVGCTSVQECEALLGGALCSGLQALYDLLWRLV